MSRGRGIPPSSALVPAARRASAAGSNAPPTAAAPTMAASSPHPPALDRIEAGRRLAAADAWHTTFDKDDRPALIEAEIANGDLKIHPARQTPGGSEPLCHPGLLAYIAQRFKFESAKYGLLVHGDDLARAWALARQRAHRLEGGVVRGQLPATATRIDGRPELVHLARARADRVVAIPYVGITRAEPIELAKVAQVQSQLAADLKRVRYLVVLVFSENESRLEIEMLFARGSELATAARTGDIDTTPELGFVRAEISPEVLTSAGSFSFPAASATRHGTLDDLELFRQRLRGL